MALLTFTLEQLQRVHPEWLARVEEWREIDTVRRNNRAEMMRFLVQGTLETAGDWAKRQKLTRFAPEAIIARHGFVGDVMDTNPNRDKLPDTTKAWAQSVDRFGRSLGEWVEQRALPLATDFGAAFAFVDSPKAPVGKTIESREDEQALGLDRVLLSAFSPLQVRNWQTDQFGGLEWVVIVLDVAAAEAQLGKREPRRRYIVLGSDEWAVYESKTKSGKPVMDPRWIAETGEPEKHSTTVGDEEEQLVGATPETGKHDCDRVPLVPLIIDPESDLVGRSLIRSAVQVDLGRYTQVSDQQYAFHSHAHPQLVLHSKKGPRDIGVGVEKVVHLNPDENESLAYTKLDATSFEQRRAEIDSARREVHRQAGGDPMAVADDASGTASGKARQVSARNSVGRHVARTRTTLGGFETSILDLAHQKQNGGKKLPDDAAVVYPTRYLQETESEIIETAALASKNTRSPQAKIELELRMLDTVLAGLPSETRSKITDEVRKLPAPAPATFQFGAPGEE